MPRLFSRFAGSVHGLSLRPAALAWLAALVGSASASASAMTPPTFAWFQATETTFGWGCFEPSTSANGRFVAFRDAYDFTGENPDVNFEIFLFDRETGGFTQLTDTPGLYGNFEPHITPDGSAVVFRSLFNFTGGNPDGSFELFEVTVATGQVKQLTFSPGSSMLTTLRMSADGNALVYLSSADGTLDVTRYRRDTSEVLSITSAPNLTTVSMPNVDATGANIVFRSNANFDGTNADGNIEIWLWHEGEGIKHVTATGNGKINESPSIDGSGRYVTFLSRANISGRNPISSREIFLADVIDNTTVQVTPSFPVGKHLEPIMSPNGEFLLFESERDLTGLNGDKNRELFRYDVGRHLITQLTATLGGAAIAAMTDQATSNYVSIALDSNHFAYRCEHVLDPSSNDPAPQVNLEIFIATADLPPILGDLDGDGTVGQQDLALCLAAWGSAGGFGTPSGADFNGDGQVDLADLSILLGAWT